MLQVKKVKFPLRRGEALNEPLERELSHTHEPPKELVCRSDGWLARWSFGRWQCSNNTPILHRSILPLIEKPVFACQGDELRKFLC